MKRDLWTNVKDLESIGPAETILLAKLNGVVDMEQLAELKWDARQGFRYIYSVIYTIKSRFGIRAESLNAKYNDEHFK